ncbi:MAG: hypothetical protein MR286_00110 [Clostridiales bacterium]|nr:hypothetical protein [Clostridiales bacterium]
MAASPPKKQETDPKEMTTEALQAAVRADLLDPEESDYHRLTQLLEELDRREASAEPPFDPTAAKARFDQTYRSLSAPLYPETPDPPPKRPRRRVLRWVLVAAVLLALAVFPAAARGSFAAPQDPWQSVDSAQIAGYSMGVEPVGQGVLSLRFALSGQGAVTALGVEELTVWHWENGAWLEALRYAQRPPAFGTETSRDYGGALRYQGWPGETYRVQITLFAETEQGTDRRSQTFQVVAR